MTMKNWQFWLLFLALLGVNGQLVAVNSQLGNVERETREIFSQARWMTWKLDQDGSARIKVDVGR
jgi:hypothetical protein